jgi:hypothetical protein
MPATPTLLMIGIPLILTAGIFWMWMKALHNEIGPSLVATVLSVGAIIVTMGFTMKMLEPPAPEQPISWDDVE